MNKLTKVFDLCCEENIYINKTMVKYATITGARINLVVGPYLTVTITEKQAKQIELIQ